MAKYYVVPFDAFPVGQTAATSATALTQIFGLKSNPNQLSLSNMHDNTSYGASIVTNPVVSGRPSTSALRVEIRTAADLATPSLDRPRAQLYTYDALSVWRQVHWHTITVMVPTAFSGSNGTWLGIMDFHGINAVGVPLSVRIVGTGANPQVQIRTRNDYDSGAVNLVSSPITKEQYFTLTFRLVWDSRTLANGGTGHITVYKDGTQIVDIARPLGSQTDENTNYNFGAVPYLKIGPQIDPNTTTGYPFIFYFDLIAFGNKDETLTSMLPVFATDPVPMPFRVSCGSNRWENFVGADTWNGDCFYRQLDSARSEVVITGTSVANTTEDARYQKARRATGSTRIEYQFNVTNATYRVICSFNDFLSNGPDERVFNVLINDVAVETGLDVFAVAGGKNRALDRSYDVTISGGVFNLKLTGTTDKMIASFSVEETAPTTILATPGFTLAGGTYDTEQDMQFTGKGDIIGGGNDANAKIWYETDGSSPDAGVSAEWVSGNIHLTDGMYDFRVFQTDPDGVHIASAIAQRNITIDTFVPPLPTQVYIDCGKTSGTPVPGWILDAHFSGFTPQAYTSPNSISNVPTGYTGSLFQSIRYSAGVNAALQYVIPVANGQYEVRLLLCEVGATGNYKYKVKLQGEGTAGVWTRVGTQATYTDLDPLTIVGRFNALMVFRAATVSAETLTLDWEKITGTSGLSVAGIQIFPYVAPVVPPKKLILGTK